jgi:RNA polymerase sigma factor (sigma-70 family)
MEEAMLAAEKTAAVRIQEGTEQAWNVEELYGSYKSYLFAIAYRMLGTVSDAEDAVQDVFVSLHGLRLKEITNPKAYLGKMITNRCLNLLGSARRKREAYVGPWLPEPVTGLQENHPLAALEQEEHLSYAYMLMLERMTPMERAVVILREVLQFDYGEVAAMTDKSEVSCRKIASRARKKLEGVPPESGPGHRPESGAGPGSGAKPGAKPKPGSGPEAHAAKEVQVRRFVAAFKRADMKELLELLNEDAVLLSDGGGKVRAAVNPIISRPRVLALLSAMASRSMAMAEARVVTVNGGPGILFTIDGLIRAVMSFRWSPDLERIERIYTVMNPEKLAHLGPVWKPE